METGREASLPSSVTQEASSGNLAGKNSSAPTSLDDVHTDPEERLFTPTAPPASTAKKKQHHRSSGDAQRDAEESTKKRKTQSKGMKMATTPTEENKLLSPTNPHKNLSRRQQRR